MIYYFVMQEFLGVLWESVLDALKILPIIFLCYLLIEFLEDKILDSYHTNRFLKGKFAPVISAGFGLIPQCGFSVVATDLYSKKAITLGSLIAIYLATSDEALLLLLPNPNNYLFLALIIVIKFVYATLIGLTIDLIFRKKASQIEGVNQIERVDGCCNHHLEGEHKKGLKEIFIHPLVHSIKIFLYIVAITFAFGLLTHYVGEDAIKNFTSSLGFFQVFFVALIGMIPNCSASVIIIEAFLSGGITFGACLAGLCANSGIALFVLFKENKKPKENVFITLSLYLLGVFLGVIVNLVEMII